MPLPESSFACLQASSEATTWGAVHVVGTVVWMTIYLADDVFVKKKHHPNISANYMNSAPSGNL